MRSTADEVGQQSQKTDSLLSYSVMLNAFPFSIAFLSSSSAPPANGFSQMARMMDSLILDSLQTTPYAYTKITTHRPVKKATSTNHLPTNGLVSSTSNQPRNGFHSSKKIPTQGEQQTSDRLPA